MHLLDYSILQLKARGIRFDTGLSAAELQAIEARYSFRFPPDYADFLQRGLPMGDKFYPWRDAAAGGEVMVLDRILAWPLVGIHFDLKHNSIWRSAWGPKPEALADQYDLLEKLVGAAPRLIPICGHRFIPDAPAEAGNPVYSVYQTDIIYYGYDLVDYLSHEFRFPPSPYYRKPEAAKPIAFWSDLVG